MFSSYRHSQLLIRPGSSSMMGRLLVRGVPKMTTTRRSTRAVGTASRRMIGARFSTSSTSGTAVTTKPKDPLELRKIAQEARQQRANQLHDEIAAITQKQDKRHVDDVAKTRSFKGFTGKCLLYLTVYCVIFLEFLSHAKRILSWASF
jgi:type IV secretory pathway TraG/TraD family ATPase VirD4